MNNPVHRRRFLQAAGALAAGWAAPSEATAAVLGGAEGAGQARLLAGCCARSYDQYMKSGQMTLEDFIYKGVELRLDGIDMTKLKRVPRYRRAERIKKANHEKEKLAV